MSNMATLAPALTKASVMARPKPMGLAAPVTMATFPDSGFSCMYLPLKLRISGTRDLPVF
jgi:hypothetical protein